MLLPSPPESGWQAIRTQGPTPPDDARGENFAQERRVRPPSAWSLHGGASTRFEGNWPKESQQKYDEMDTESDDQQEKQSFGRVSGVRRSFDPMPQLGPELPPPRARTSLDVEGPADLGEEQGDLLSVGFERDRIPDLDGNEYKTKGRPKDLTSGGGQGLRLGQGPAFLLAGRVQRNNQRTLSRGDDAPAWRRPEGEAASVLADRLRPYRRDEFDPPGQELGRLPQKPAFPDHHHHQARVSSPSTSSSGSAGTAKATKVNTYNSYDRFRPDQYGKGTPEWEMAMLQYLLDMKQNGHKIKEVETNKVSWRRAF